MSVDLVNGKGMTFTDKIYYKVFKAYRDKFDESDPEICAIMYLVVMMFFHSTLLLKFLSIIGVEIDISEFSLFEKSVAIISAFVLFSVRYYYFFDPHVFEIKYNPSNNYKFIILYTAVFMILFFVINLNF